MAGPRREGGFTIIEAMVAVSVLAVALVLTMQPIMAALNRVADARLITVAENLGQAEVESLRALDYTAIGLPGRTPSGVLTESRVVTVEGRQYLIEVDVRYAGSLTGVDVIPQGGDGVQGSWDPGVDYKVVTVKVTAPGREHDPVIMETIIAPRSMGAHEGIANARVMVAAYEPIEASELPLPVLQVVSPPAAPISSAMSADEQVFPGIPPGEYTVSLGAANGWIIHPDDVVAGFDRITVQPGSLADTTLRVYRPATLIVDVVDSVTGTAIANATLSVVLLDSDRSLGTSAGQTTVTGLIPGWYDITVSAPGYQTQVRRSEPVPLSYPDPQHRVTMRLDTVVATTTTTTVAPPGVSTTTTLAATTTTAAAGVPVSFTVRDNTNRVVAGASIAVTDGVGGSYSLVTNSFGVASLSLVPGRDHQVTASTPWGHGPRSAVFNPSNTSALTLTLTRTTSEGTMVLRDGLKAEYLYRVKGTTTWTVIPSNHLGEASFVALPAKFEVAKRCLGNGSVLGQKDADVKRNENRTTDVRGSCP